MDKKWRTLMDQIIDEARERGEFDPTHLHGKPLGDGRDEVNAGDRAMANKVLKNSGNLPPFLAKKAEIDRLLAHHRERLATYHARRGRLEAEADLVEDAQEAAAIRRYAVREWEWAVERYREAIPEINRMIESYNLINPISQMFRMKINLEREINRVVGEDS